jgi:hypothetical protein
MRTLSSYLSIAGIAHRQAQELKKVIAGNRHYFPAGDMPHFASEVACCEGIVALVQSVLAHDLEPDELPGCSTPR